MDLAPSADAGYNLAFATEKHYARPVWPTVDGEPQMSLHLDIEVDDLEQAVAYAVEVGAEQAEYQPQESVRVMLDPAGHPFCLYTDSPRRATALRARRTHGGRGERLVFNPLATGWRRLPPRSPLGSRPRRIV